jgi:hypothetical protein
MGGSESLGSEPKILVPIFSIFLKVLQHVFFIIALHTSKVNASYH